MCWASMDFFLNKILPPISPQLNVDRVLEYCKTKELLTKDKSGSYVWAPFLEDPKNNNTHETVVFEPLKDIFNFITKAGEETQENGEDFPDKTTYLHVDGNKVTWSEKKSDLKPDAHVHLIEPTLGYPKKTEDRHWYNSAFVLEFKKHSNQELEVISFFSL